MDRPSIKTFVMNGNTYMLQNYYELWSHFNFDKLQNMLCFIQNHIV